jgi:hypothetical protein
MPDVRAPIAGGGRGEVVGLLVKITHILGPEIGVALELIPRFVQGELRDLMYLVPALK